MDFGADYEWAPLKGQCFEMTESQYVYKICLFDRTTQKDKNSGSETTLGFVFSACTHLWFYLILPTSFSFLYQTQFYLTGQYSFFISVTVIFLSSGVVFPNVNLNNSNDGPNFYTFKLVGQMGWTR